MQALLNPIVEVLDETDEEAATDTETDASSAVMNALTQSSDDRDDSVGPAIQPSVQLSMQSSMQRQYSKAPAGSVHPSLGPVDTDRDTFASSMQRQYSKPAGVSVGRSVSNSPSRSASSSVGMVRSITRSRSVTVGGQSALGSPIVLAETINPNEMFPMRRLTSMTVSTNNTALEGGTGDDLSNDDSSMMRRRSSSSPTRAVSTFGYGVPSMSRAVSSATASVSRAVSSGSSMTRKISVSLGAIPMTADLFRDSFEGEAGPEGESTFDDIADLMVRAPTTAEATEEELDELAAIRYVFEYYKPRDWDAARVRDDGATLPYEIQSLRNRSQEELLLRQLEIEHNWLGADFPVFDTLSAASENIEGDDEGSDVDDSFDRENVISTSVKAGPIINMDDDNELEDSDKDDDDDDHDDDNDDIVVDTPMSDKSADDLMEKLTSTGAFSSPAENRGAVIKSEKKPPGLGFEVLMWVLLTAAVSVLIYLYK
jgi:hypothetical protein